MTSFHKSYFEVLTAAVNDLATNGYDSAERVLYWSKLIRDAAEQSMAAPHEMERMLREAMAAVYRRMVEKGGIAQYHQGVGRFTIEKLKPHLRAELDRRILAAANLIKMSRNEAVEKTLRRFSGWSTSIPAGGSKTTDKTKEKDDLKKAMRSLPFQERRVLIDQGHKLVASINEIVASDGGAIGGFWRSHWRQAGYDYREDHKERDGKFYLLRDSWAAKAGLVKPGEFGYYDKITAAAEEPFCHCFVVWVYALSKVPKDVLTRKGEMEIVRVKREMAA